MQIFKNLINKKKSTLYSLQICNDMFQVCRSAPCSRTDPHMYVCQVDVTSLLTQAGVTLGELVRGAQQLAQRLQELQLDCREITCFKYLILFNPGKNKGPLFCKQKIFTANAVYLKLLYSWLLWLKQNTYSLVIYYYCVMALCCVLAGEEALDKVSMQYNFFMLQCHPAYKHCNSMMESLVCGQLVRLCQVYDYIVCINKWRLNVGKLSGT